MNTTHLLVLKSRHFLESNTETYCTEKQIFSWIQHWNFLYWKACVFLNTTLKRFVLKSRYFHECNTEPSYTEKQVFSWIQHWNFPYWKTGIFLNTTLKLLVLKSRYFREYNTEISCTEKQLFSWIQHWNFFTKSRYFLFKSRFCVRSFFFNFLKPLCSAYSDFKLCILPHTVFTFSQ